MPTLSVILLTHNTGEIIKDVVRQLDKAADEIIVVDDLSEDNTTELVRKTTKKAKIIRHKLTNHGEQRNIGYARATGEWLAWADDDEVWSDELVEEVKKVKELDGYGYDGFELLFRTPVLGGVIEDEWHLRLFRKGKGKNTPSFHTTVEMTAGSKISKIKRGHVLHLKWEGAEAWLKKHIFYSKMDVDSYLERGLKVSPWKMLAMFFIVFLKRLKLVKQGPAGFVWALAASTSWIFKACFLIEARQKRQNHRKTK
ncbi:MAG: glycosyltransferase family 2 protein [Candidatus Aenigmarchaeota archaeon]|nr:glycosyltransferase family 2 protein [Candidatus Aenigmarchaeota archaeon]